MIIDLILDRKDGQPYNPHSFYNRVMGYGETFPELSYPIADALDGGNNEDVKKALCGYIKSEGYNPDIINYVNANNWL